MNNTSSTIEDIKTNFTSKITTIKKCNIYNQLVSKGQKPKVMVISCCDSRIDPALLFNAYFGDIFVVRSIANIVPNIDSHDISTAAAIEFAINNLDITDIIILGHSKCAGIEALCQREHHTRKASCHIDKWLSTAKESITTELSSYPSHIQNELDKQGMRTLACSWHNILQYPAMKNNLAVKAHAWYFDINSKALSIYNHEKNHYENINDD